MIDSDRTSIHRRLVLIKLTLAHSEVDMVDVHPTAARTVILASKLISPILPDLQAGKQGYQHSVMADV